MAGTAVILDTSAIVAILTHEEAAEALLEKLFAASLRIVPTPCAAEALIVLNTKLGYDPDAVLHEFFREFGIELFAFSPKHLSWFNHGFRNYGKGKHPAALNMGDCFTYAITRTLGFPLLYTGNDFTKTDLVLS